MISHQCGSRGGSARNPPALDCRLRHTHSGTRSAKCGDLICHSSKGVEQAEQCGGQLTAPERPRTVVVLAPDNRAAQRPLGLVVVHRDSGVLDEQDQP